ncbi:MAG TPA: aminoglycoside phosphotransferase family protein [Micromonosporaceae bacterium]|nr:aminoglycoside phosphotransferase family protein [Micromonosporaceae bacterium]
MRDDRSAPRDAWLRDLPRLVASYADRWSLDLEPPYQPGGRSAWVAPALDRDGREVVLKVAWHHDEAIHEADGLQAWAGDGAVRLYEQAAERSATILLLERCRPGTPVGEARAEPDQDVVVAGLLRRLWQAPIDDSAFRPLSVMCDSWAAEFQQRLALGPGQLDPGLARAGMELFRTLPATAERRVLLCTDLHAGNILAAEREPWLAIDPKPYVGDPTYDSLQHLLNCDRLHTDPVRLAHRMADLLELEPGRLIQWLFARCVQESIDQPDLRDVAARLAPT